MTLDKYRTNDLVVLPPTVTVQAAARAFEHDGIGAVLVHDGTSLVGIVTDRDIALRVVGCGSRPDRTVLRDVMSRDVAALPASASEGEAGRLMLERRVRRIALLQGVMPVGIVTLDDLIVDQALSPSMIATIIREQLSKASPMDRKSAAFRATPLSILSAGA